MVIDKINIAFEYYISKKRLKELDSRDKIKEYHSKSIERLLNTILPKSKYYSNLYEGYNLKDWETLPIISKKDWMQNFKDINVLGISEKEALDIAVKSEENRDFSPTINGITVGLSSGTSGNRGLWLVSPKERYKWVGNVLAKHIPGGLFSKEKIAFFLRANSNLYKTLGTSRLQFEFFDLLNPLEDNIKKINEYAPTIISSPPSMLSLLVNSGKLTIRPKKVISVADVLEKNEEEKLKEHFQLNHIDQFYQATEGFIATTCPKGTLHINEDMVAVQEEWINKDLGRYTPIVTDFQRITQPLIRYRLNDILVEGDGCSCGSSFKTLKRIEGRHDDIIYLPNKKGEIIPIFPDFFRQAIISQTDIKEYEIKQRDENTLELYLDGKETPNFNPLFNKYGVSPHIIYYKGIPEKSNDEKRRRIKGLGN